MITLVVVPAGANTEVRVSNTYCGIFHSFVRNSDTQKQSLQFNFILPGAPTHLNYDNLHPTKCKKKINKQKAQLNEVESLEWEISHSVIIAQPNRKKKDSSTFLATVLLNAPW